VKDYIGKCSEYRQYIRDYRASQAEGAGTANRTKANANTDIASGNKKRYVPTPEESTAPVRKKYTWKEQREMEQLENDIESLEKEKKELETALSSGTLSSDELTKASIRYSEVTMELDGKEMRYLELL